MHEQSLIIKNHTMRPKHTVDLSRPYLVIPKLIIQPTWGGQYIVASKGWETRDNLGKLRIGQSYELFSGSNLSFLTSSDDPQFFGELTDRDAVQIQTHPENSCSLSDLIAKSAEDTLGANIVRSRGPNLDLLIKYTQALGNSYQVHTKSDVKHPVWKPKPESWYFFEPGLITLGVKPETNWDEYQNTLKQVSNRMLELGNQVSDKTLSYEQAVERAHEIVNTYNPEQYVNVVPVEKDQLVDLSEGGLQHSWEEDSARYPLGNVLYEVQNEALDKVSTFRAFDKGKLGVDGTVRQVHLKEYFKYIDRTPEMNTPASHIRQPVLISETGEYKIELLLKAGFYTLERITFSTRTSYTDEPDHFRHLFVKSGRIEVTAGNHSLIVSVGHSCFIPAAAKSYTIHSLTRSCEVLLSY